MLPKPRAIILTPHPPLAAADRQVWTQYRVGICLLDLNLGSSEHHLNGLERILCKGGLVLLFLYPKTVQKIPNSCDMLSHELTFPLHFISKRQVIQMSSGMFWGMWLCIEHQGCSTSMQDPRSSSGQVNYNPLLFKRQTSKPRVTTPWSFPS